MHSYLRHAALRLGEAYDPKPADQPVNAHVQEVRRKVRIVIQQIAGLKDGARAFGWPDEVVEAQFAQYEQLLEELLTEDLPRARMADGHTERGVTDG